MLFILPFKLRDPRWNVQRMKESAHVEQLFTWQRKGTIFKQSKQVKE